MKTQEKKTGLRNLGFTEIINLAVITGGDSGDIIDKSETTEDKSKKKDDQG